MCDEAGGSVGTEQRLQGRVVLVTGGSSGIGRAACVGLAADGAHVVAVGRDRERLETVAGEARRAAAYGARVLSLELDVVNESHTTTMVDRTLDEFGHIDVMVTAAGVLRATDGWARKVQDMKLDAWKDVVRTNLTGVFLSNRAVLPVMIRQRHGDIINVSSTSGLKGLAFDSAYCASKFGVAGLSEALAEEVARFGIRVHVLFPGAVDTSMWRAGDSIPHLGPALPVGRVVDVIRYLAGLDLDTRLCALTLTPLGSARLSGDLMTADIDRPRP